MNQRSKQFYCRLPARNSGLILQLRDLVLETYPTALEQVDMPARIIGYGKDRTYRGMVCAIAPQRKYVNLMFARGLELADVEQILEGTGKCARHIKIHNPADVTKPSVRELLLEAIELLEGEPNDRA